MLPNIRFEYNSTLKNVFKYSIRVTTILIFSFFLSIISSSIALTIHQVVDHESSDHEIGGKISLDYIVSGLRMGGSPCIRGYDLLIRWNADLYGISDVKFTNFLGEDSEGTSVSSVDHIGSTEFDSSNFHWTTISHISFLPKSHLNVAQSDSFKLATVEFKIVSSDVNEVSPNGNIEFGFASLDSGIDNFVLDAEGKRIKDDLRFCAECPIQGPEPVVEKIISRVSKNSDDAEEILSNGKVLLNSSDLELAEEPLRGEQLVGIRFESVQLPPGAKIIDAYLQFTVDEPSKLFTFLEIQGESSPHSQTFSSINRNLSDRNATQASIAWNPKEWRSIGASGLDQRTPNISSILQEITNLSTWSIGNAVTLLIRRIEGNRTAISNDNDSSKSPFLVVDYIMDDSHIPSNIPNDYLVYLKFEENTLNESGIKHGDFIGNKEKYVSGVLGQSIQLENSNEYVEISETTPFDITQSISLLSWVKLNRITPFGKIIVKPLEPVENPWELYTLDMGVDGKSPRFAISTGEVGSWHGVNSTQSLDLNKWYHIAGIYDGTILKIYINGEEVNKSTAQLIIGNNHLPIKIGDVQGHVDEVLIYDRAISPTEVINIYNTQKLNDDSEPPDDPELPKDLIASYKFEGSTIDETGNHPGLYIGNVETYENGINGDGVVFSEPNEFVRVPDSNAFNDINEFTLIAWIKLNSFSRFGKIIVKPLNPVKNPWELFTLDMGTDGQTPRVAISTGVKDSWHGAVSDRPLELQEWYQLVGTYDGEELKLYVNGGLTGKEIVSLTIGQNNEPLRMGGNNAVIDEVAIYSRALDEDEILTDYINTLPKLPGGKARYRVSIQNTWSVDTHPGAFPENAHFSFVAAATHNAQSPFWEEGTFASPGFVKLAETGLSDLLIDEIKASVVVGDSEQVVDLQNWICPGGIIHNNCGKNQFEFEISKSHSYFSMASMLGPSPDWFIGVSGLDLLETGELENEC